MYIYIYMCMYKVCSPPPTSHGLMKLDMLVPTYMYVYILRVFMYELCSPPPTSHGLMKLEMLSGALFLSRTCSFSLSLTNSLFLSHTRSFSRLLAHGHTPIYNYTHAYTCNLHTPTYTRTWPPIQKPPCRSFES